MFNFLKSKKSEGESVVLKINGMHCVSCSMNIDGELEELAGVTDVKTSYAKGVTEIKYNPTKISVPEMTAVVEKLGYKVMI